jgi:5'-methylthioadenosine phosphorylase
MKKQTIAVIGGSGLYELDDLREVKERTVETPFGPPSDAIIEGMIDETRLLFLARHGRGHRLLPSEVNYRANIFALKSLGAEQVVSISAVGSMREEIKPGDLVVVDQFIDRTKGRPSTFFGRGIVGHVMFADPVCPELAGRLYEVASALEVKVHRGATLMVMEGPAFSTRAESHLHRQLGVDLIGMTAMPEAKLAREAELCYATLALATDYDCWHEEEDDVSVDAVVKILKQNAQNARTVVSQLAKTNHVKGSCSCGTALDFAIITDKKAIPSEIVDEMKPVFGRVL